MGDVIEMDVYFEATAKQLEAMQYLHDNTTTEV
jgi:hypothetical protein